jgi:hypothetical protein
LFIVHYARLAGIQVSLIEDTKNVWAQRKVRGSGWPHGKGNLVSCVYNGKRIMFECSDFPELGEEHIRRYQDRIPIFKFHYDGGLHSRFENVFPIGPCLVLPSDLSAFEHYLSKRETFRYTCSTDVVSNRQEPRRLALERRTHVQRLLKRKYGDNLDLNWKGTQEGFWNANEDCLASICVPGACNNMLDRGHYELLGLGVCTISPFIPTVLPWNKNLVPGEHYIQCKDDYSDLVDKIEFCRGNRKESVRIGDNAKALFAQCSTPSRYWQWIDACIGKNE